MNLQAFFLFLCFIFCIHESSLKRSWLNTAAFDFENALFGRALRALVVNGFMNALLLLGRKEMSQKKSSMMPLSHKTGDWTTMPTK